MTVQEIQKYGLKKCPAEGPKSHQPHQKSCTGCSLSDYHILLPINPKYKTDFVRFTQIVLKFKTQVLPVLNFRTICVNLRNSDKILPHILG